MFSFASPCPVMSKLFLLCSQLFAKAKVPLSNGLTFSFIVPCSILGWFFFLYYITMSLNWRWAVYYLLPASQRLHAHLAYSDLMLWSEWTKWMLSWSSVRRWRDWIRGSMDLKTVSWFGSHGCYHQEGWWWFPIIAKMYAHLGFSWREVTSPRVASFLQ